MYPTQPIIRKRGSTRVGREFTPAQKIAVWQKCRPAPGLEMTKFRLDSCGAVIAWSDYGNTKPFGNGWEIDHIFPVARGGTDVTDNLQALQWENNREKGDQTTGNYCKISKSGK